jgi:hypothetical protein
LIARPVDGERRSQAAVCAEAEVDERAGEADARDVLSVDRVDGSERRGGDEDEQEELVPRSPPRQRRRAPEEPSTALQVAPNMGPPRRSTVPVVELSGVRAS